MKRLFDFSFAILVSAILFIPIIIIAILVKLTSKGPVLYWSDRVGINNIIFRMPKFRSMKQGTPTVATHLLKNPENALTPIGAFLRKSSLDELPQLWCILKAEMSFVGPRPALFNQDDLIELRNKHGIEKLLPGLTGWAQINGRDELQIPQKVIFEIEYMKRKNFLFDCHILFLTFLKIFYRDDISF
ncbi:MAG: sugar transferase [Methylococcaceae bacterium]|nr:sugar transferase [Methylococcaceae bacterium]